MYSASVLSGLLIFTPLYLTSFIPPTLATPLPPSNHDPSPYPVSLLHQFPPGVWAENLATTSTNSLLITIMSTPDLLLYDPAAPSLPPTLLHSFADNGPYASLLGIAATSANSFAVVAGNYSLTSAGAIPGTFAIFTITLPPTGSLQTPQVKLLAPLPDAQFINGLVYHAYPSPAVLAADSTLGTITRIELATGAVSTLLEVEAFKPCGDSKEGLNGFHIHAPTSTLYFTNSACRTFGKVPVRRDGSQAGEARVTVTYPAPYFFDDFALGGDGTAWVAVSNGNGIARIAEDGEVEVVAGSVNSTEVAEPTALVWGREGEVGKGGERVLYVTTGGALGDPINGTVVVGAQVLRIGVEGGW
ncbi:uncharacterized protein BDZ99DRAFT_454955 [Mytilinidion resinicola]|uniref:SMP-30/Gluconolactonase/LRE-like region domain-containing protein n=1 Tax=Mytilinidion resinicola TaxID=574789 RepID=A0A6A6Y069_9PEZI|nr:uncharacterized protein BDZ99DRAFT_454955 [Mytilinidion resinicola]KAF2802216.1 hypothetical protein BDZ99DRAFT_454955 [Mytilinidion resinicola]